MKNGPGVDARSDRHDEMMAAFALSPEALENALEWFSDVESADHPRIKAMILSAYLETTAVDELIAERVEQEWLDGLDGDR
jgi:hypothetical protein